MKAIIYKPAKTAMQSGMAKTKDWLLRFKSDTPEFTEPLMGWTGSVDTSGQITLYFDSEEEAVAYAKKRNIPYEVKAPKKRQTRPKSYAENFRFNRTG